MNCPNDSQKMEKALFHNVDIDYCPDCLGIWFDKDELTYAKDNKDEKLNWVDVDIWKDKRKFKVIRITKFCPVCRVGLTEINYDQSKTKVDYCKKCQGVWLDRGEFKQIINYLKNKSDYGILNHYTKNLSQELWEVFMGPQTFREEIGDFFMLLKLFNYKFASQHPHIEKLVDNLPK